MTLLFHSSDQTMCLLHYVTQLDKKKYTLDYVTLTKTSLSKCMLSICMLVLTVNYFLTILVDWLVKIDCASESHFPRSQDGFPAQNCRVLKTNMLPGKKENLWKNWVYATKNFDLKPSPCYIIFFQKYSYVFWL